MLELRTSNPPVVINLKRMYRHEIEFRFLHGQEDFGTPMATILETLKAQAVLKGYRFEETEFELTMIRPDGSIAMRTSRPGGNKALFRGFAAASISDELQRLGSGKDTPQGVPVAGQPN